MPLSSAPMRRQAGFSLIEVVVAMTIFLVVLSFSLPFFNSQSRAITTASGQGDMVRGLQFAIAQIDRDLRMAGAGTYFQQPMLIQIAPLALTFNANSSSPDSTDVRAVYWDPDADSTTQTSLTTASPVTLPLAVGYASVLNRLTMFPPVFEPEEISRFLDWFASVSIRHRVHYLEPVPESPNSRSARGHCNFQVFQVKAISRL